MMGLFPAFPVQSSGRNAGKSGGSRLFPCSRLFPRIFAGDGCPARGRNIRAGSEAWPWLG